jgi:hypothetical protein
MVTKKKRFITSTPRNFQNLRPFSFPPSPSAWPGRACSYFEASLQMKFLTDVSRIKFFLFVADGGAKTSPKGLAF